MHICSAVSALPELRVFDLSWQSHQHAPSIFICRRIKSPSAPVRRLPVLQPLAEDLFRARVSEFLCEDLVLLCAACHLHEVEGDGELR